jgi:hypothetical protein
MKSASLTSASWAAAAGAVLPRTTFRHVSSAASLPRPVGRRRHRDHRVPDFRALPASALPSLVIPAAECRPEIGYALASAVIQDALAAASGAFTGQPLRPSV